MQFDRIISVRNNRTVFRDGELCIKVLEDDFPASFVLSEATNMVAAAEAGLNVPKLREVNLHGNKRLITYDYIVGSPILCSDRDDADFRAQRLNLLIDAQLSINGTRCPECIRNPRPEPKACSNPDCRIDSVPEEETESVSASTPPPRTKAQAPSPLQQSHCTSH